MSRSKLLVCAVPVLGLLLSSPLLAQSRSTFPRSTTNGTPTTGGTTNGRRREPCWKQAGIPQSVIQQHKSIEQTTRSQIEAVCSDTSLTPEQRHEKAHQIREQARQRQDAMLSASQRSSFQSCRSQRGEGGTPGLGGENLCGGTSSTRGMRPAKTGNGTSTTPEEDN